MNVLLGTILTHEEQIPSEQFSWDEFMDKWLIDKMFCEYNYSFFSMIVTVFKAWMISCIP